MPFAFERWSLRADESKLWWKSRQASSNETRFWIAIPTFSLLRFVFQQRAFFSRLKNAGETFSVTDTACCHSAFRICIHSPFHSQQISNFSPLTLFWAARQRRLELPGFTGTGEVRSPRLGNSMKSLLRIFSIALTKRCFTIACSSRQSRVIKHRGLLQ